jgi:hypothetical protein
MKAYLGGQAPEGGQPGPGETNDTMKYSAMLIDLAKPYHGPDPDIKEYEDLMNIVVQAWNIANLKKLVPEMFPTMLEHAKKMLEDRKLKKLLDNLIKDKLRKYNHQDVFIPEYVFTKPVEDQSDFLLTVTAMPMDAFLAYLKARQDAEDSEPVPIDREILIVRPKQPFLDWIKKNDSAFDDSKPYEPGIFLIREAEDDEEAEEIIKEKAPAIFIQMLSDFTPDASKWPEETTYEMFREWFEIENCPTAYDLEPYPVSKT